VRAVLASRARPLQIGVFPIQVLSRAMPVILCLVVLADAFFQR
jgi:hypothetical protein